MKFGSRRIGGSGIDVLFPAFADQSVRVNGVSIGKLFANFYLHVRWKSLASMTNSKILSIVFGVWLTADALGNITILL